MSNACESEAYRVGFHRSPRWWNFQRQPSVWTAAALEAGFGPTAARSRPRCPPRIPETR